MMLFLMGGCCCRGDYWKHFIERKTFDNDSIILAFK
jgi:hypothetical protein